MTIGYDPEELDQPYWVRDWENPAIIRACVAKLDGHPMRNLLGRMLGGLLRRHAPQNISFIPPEWQEPSQ